MKQWIACHFEEHLSLLKTLAAIPAPSHQEDRRAAFIKNYLEEAGAPGVYIDQAKNVLLPLGCEGRKDITVYMAHTDVVFPDLTPLPVSEADGKLYAPGVGDDTANVAAILSIIRYILEKKHSPREPVLFVLNSCEEGLGNLKGVRRLMQDYAGRIKEVISFDGTLSGGLVTRAVGSHRWRVKVSTAGGHSYGAFGNPNAIHHLALLIEKLYRQNLPEWADQKTTYNVGTISGGTTVNSIAQEAEMLYEYRSDDEKALAMMQDQFFRILEETRGPKALIEEELLGERPCGGAVDPEARKALWDRCGGALSAVLGYPAPHRSGSTDANLPLSLGVPAVTFGLYDGAGEHTREEWLDIASLKPGLELGLGLVLGHFC
ncbi:MAG: M20/M25/M40 family metallo-hydrolase [Lachnospiraceae bacterium]|nr:M20/M25/M40 family metallo-hydrolase [Lachnospiraceae bacterium]